jgi:hypothetical protein
MMMMMMSSKRGPARGGRKMGVVWSCRRRARGREDGEELFESGSRRGVAVFHNARYNCMKVYTGENKAHRSSTGASGGVCCFDDVEEDPELTLRLATAVPLPLPSPVVLLSPPLPLVTDGVRRRRMGKEEYRTGFGHTRVGEAWTCAMGMDGAVRGRKGGAGGDRRAEKKRVEKRSKEVTKSQ